MKQQITCRDYLNQCLGLLFYIRDTYSSHDDRRMYLDDKKLSKEKAKELLDNVLEAAEGYHQCYTKAKLYDDKDRMLKLFKQMMIMAGCQFEREAERAAEVQFAMVTWGLPALNYESTACGVFDPIFNSVGGKKKKKGLTFKGKEDWTDEEFMEDFLSPVVYFSYCNCAELLREFIDSWERIEADD